MDRYFSKLKTRDLVSLFFLLVIVMVWLLTDQLFLAGTGQRFFALMAVVLAAFYLQFFFNRPEKIVRYANSLAIISLLVAVIAGMILHVFIRHDFSYKQLLIWTIAAVAPYLSALLYTLTQLKKR